MKKFKFSIIIDIYEYEQYLDDTVKSIIYQDIGFEENIQLILVDEKNTDKTRQSIYSYQHLYPENIIGLTASTKSSSFAKNLGLKKATGEFVGFMNNGDKLSKNSLGIIDDFFNNHDVDVVSIPIEPLNTEKGNHLLNYRFKNNPVINLKSDIDCPQLYVPSSFIQKNAIKNEFNENLTDGSDLIFINEILIKKQKYGVISNAKYFCRKSSKQRLALEDVNKSFRDKVNFVYKYLVDLSLKNEDGVLDFIQFIILADLKKILLFDGFENIFNDAEHEKEFRSSIFQILKYIDENIILNHRLLNKNLKSFLIYIKNNDFYAVKNRKNILFKSGDYLIGKLNNRIQIDVIELKNDVLNISGFFISNCSNRFISFEAVKVDNNGFKEIFNPEYVEYVDRKNDNFMGIDWIFKYSFDFKIPIENNLLNRIYFNIIYDEKKNHLKRKCKIKFAYFANLSKISTYFFKDSKIVYYHNNNIFIDNYSFKKMCIRESRVLSKIIHSNREKIFKVILFRIIHLFLFIFLKNKRIWLFEDRLTFADDNAEYLFKYAVTQKDDIKKYYVIQKDCDDFKRMSEINKNIIPFGSFKHKCFYLLSEKVISSHIDHSVLNPFLHGGYNLILLNGLFTVEFCFLQHGIIKDDLSYWLRKHCVNLFLFLTSSDYEYRSLFDEQYNYDRDVVQLLGLPRFDTLNNNNVKRQILFMPTWRDTYTDEKSFKNSNFFKTLNKFINNEKLINYLSKHDFQLIFKPHFGIMPYIDLFNIPNEVKLLTKESYQKLFNESSILITDFSSVAFDFSYLKKPIIYYQPENNYHNPKGYFDYETMGFGEVIRSEDELVDMIIDYINHDCKMKNKYVDRVNRFYRFNDKNNCERVYNWLNENK